MEHSLSANDILNLAQDRCNIITYSELSRIDDLDVIFMKNNEIVPCVILYETRKNYGHWTCFIRINSIAIEHFDPYGYSVDEQLAFIDDYFRDENNSLPHLSWLIAKSEYKKIITNNTELQKIALNVNTCGRWISLRILYWNLFGCELCKFVKMFIKIKKNKSVKVDLDELSVILTS